MFKSIKCLLTPYKTKVEVLKNKAFDYYYTIFLNTAKVKNAEGVQIPLFVIEERVFAMAKQEAKEQIDKVIAENRVHRCYKKAICG